MRAKRMRKAGIILILSGAHFGLCKLLSRTLLAVMAAHASVSESAFSQSLLSGLAKVLYFPILSLHLYARNWFPGDLIVIVLAANSLVWGTTLYGLFVLIRKIRPKGGLP